MDAQEEMVEVFFVLVNDGSIFSYMIPQNVTVHTMKAILTMRMDDTVRCEPRKIKLYLAKNKEGWLNSHHDDVAALKRGEITGVVESLMAVEEINPADGLDDVNSEGGVPVTFRTYRSTTVEAFFRILFPQAGVGHLPLIFVRAPPLSGKTGLFDLLYNYIVSKKPGVLAARINAKVMPDYVDFSGLYGSTYACDFRVFCELKGDRVVLIDEAQMTYDDELLWLGFLKNTLDGKYPGLRFVLFSSYCSFDIYRTHERSGTPIVIPPDNTFGLSRTELKPGLYILRAELDEMVEDTIGAQVSDLIWQLYSGHIGIARAMLRFLSDRFGSKPPVSINPRNLELELRSAELLEYIGVSYRGIPTLLLSSK